ncbi:hypothetical protein DPMN_031128 [Dreissena polymorpha]|uniref:Uncharacterized protein n=1 Tax=Dreissena polymorpha TaxID=45954 RepID=A0A9D4RIR4_DREPO|nr:hypothetical protein DPMN_031128 [Dreissena polymorpha]
MECRARNTPHWRPSRHLEQVHVLVRHGARTPLHLIANVEEVEYSKPFFLDDVPHTTYNYSVNTYMAGQDRSQSMMRMLSNILLREVHYLVS